MIWRSRLDPPVQLRLPWMLRFNLLSPPGAPVDAPLEEALAALAGEDAVVLAVGPVPTHHAVHLQPDCSSSPGSVSLAVPQGEAEEAAGGLQGPGASALELPPLCGRTFPAGASGRAPASLALSTAHPGIRPRAAAGFLWDSFYNFSVLLCLSFQWLPVSAA